MKVSKFCKLVANGINFHFRSTRAFNCLSSFSTTFTLLVFHNHKMNSKLKSWLIAFLGIRLARHMYFSPTRKYFTECHFYADSLVPYITYSRVPFTFALLMNSTLQPYIIEMRLTDTWIKNAFYALLLYIYTSFPLLWTCCRQHIRRYPNKWRHHIDLYRYFDIHLTIDQQSIHEFACQHSLSLSDSRSHLQQLSHLIKLSLAMWFNFLLLVCGFETFSLVDGMKRKKFLFIAIICQLTTVVHFKLAFNYVSESVGLTFVFFFSKIAHFRQRSQQLIGHLQKILNRQIRLFGNGKVGGGGGGVERYSWLDKSAGNVIKDKKLYFSQSLVKSNSDYLTRAESWHVMKQFGRLSEEVQFCRLLVASTLGNIYLCASFCTVGYIFMINFSSIAFVNRYFLMFGIGALSIPFLTPPCVFGQLLINQCYRITAQMHSLCCRTSCTITKRKANITFTAIGIQCDLFDMELLYQANYSNLTLVRVKK